MKAKSNIPDIKIEALMKSIKNQIELINKQDELHLNFLSLKAKNLENQRNLIYNNEPLKLFKKKHSQWENDLQKIENDLFNIYESIGNSLEENYKFWDDLCIKKEPSN